MYMYSPSIELQGDIQLVLNLKYLCNLQSFLSTAATVDWVYLMRVYCLVLMQTIYFNNNDNSKISYLFSSLPQRDQVIYSSMPLNVFVKAPVN